MISQLHNYRLLNLYHLVTLHKLNILNKLVVYGIAMKLNLICIWKANIKESCEIPLNVNRA